MNETLLTGCGRAYGAWQQSLAARNNKALTDEERAVFEARQQELLAVVADGPKALARHIRARLGISAETAIDAPPLPRRMLTPGEFREPPIQLEQDLADAWDGLVRPGQAAQPLFWLLCHIEWIGEGRIDGLEDALTGGRKENTADQRTRNLLRRTGGLPHVRYSVTAFSDCPLARAWWVRRVAADAERASDGALSVEDAHRALHDHRQVWATLAMLSVRRVTAISHPRARAALVAAIAGGTITERAVLLPAAEELARHALTRSLQHVPWADLLEIAERAANAYVHSVQSATDATAA